MKKEIHTSKGTLHDQASPHEIADPKEKRRIESIMETRMKKSERLHQMLKWINERRRFTLRDVMEEFRISKRTALRDIASLEQLGAPIYAEYGRHGGYTLIRPVRLPPISFTAEEVYALYLSLQILASVSDIPFKATYSSIDRKFTEALSERQKEQVRRIRHRVGFYVTRQQAACPWLETVIAAATENKGLNITYRGEARRIQPLFVYLMKGYWYCRSVDLDKKSHRVFRCDRIEYAEPADIEPIGEPAEHPAQWRQPSANAVPFKCRLDPDGAERFRAESYPSMKLVEEQGEKYMAGTFEPEELDFMLKYFSRFGTSLKVIEPEWIKERLRAYYLELIEHL